MIPVCPHCATPAGTVGDPYKWQFYLWVEDEMGSMLPLIVADDEAEYLLSLKPDK